MKNWLNSWVKAQRSPVSLSENLQCCGTGFQPVNHGQDAHAAFWIVAVLMRSPRKTIRTRHDSEGGVVLSGPRIFVPLDKRGGGAGGVAGQVADSLRCYPDKPGSEQELCVL